MSKYFEYLTLTTLLVRVPLVLCSFLFLYTGLLLYETEQGQIQNRLEEWWCKLDDVATTALSRNLRILQGIAVYFQMRLESTFGRALFSLQSFGVSICWGMISAKFTIVIIGLLGRNRLFLILGQFVGILLFWYLSQQPRRLPRSRHTVWFGIVLLAWIMLIISAYTSGTLGNAINGPPPVPSTNDTRIVRLGLAVVPLYTLGVLVSTIFTFAFVLISRRSLSHIITATRKGAVIKALVTHSILLLLAISLHLALSDQLKTPTDFRDYIFLISTPTMGYIYWMTISLAFFILHIIFWEFMQRPLYALQRLGGEKRNKLFVMVGLLLIGLAFPGAGEAIKSVLSSIKSVFV